MLNAASSVKIVQSMLPKMVRFLSGKLESDSLWSKDWLVGMPDLSNPHWLAQHFQEEAYSRRSDSRRYSDAARGRTYADMLSNIWHSWGTTPNAASKRPKMMANKGADRISPTFVD